jgi:hypothetical protein
MKTIINSILLCSTLAYGQSRNIVINECMPNNTITSVDQDGEYNDWVELFNISESEMNLEGYFLSDRRSEPTKFKFPNTSISPKDYLIIWIDKDTLQVGLHTNFKLSAIGEHVYLFNPDTLLIDYVHFFNMQEDESIGRTKDGNGPFEILSPTFNESNGNDSGSIVINEWMALNESQNADEYGEYNDWIELFNNSNQYINLEGYFISNKVTERTKYKFSTLILEPYGFALLWADEDTLQGEFHLPFKLDSERDDLVLSRPDTSTIDYFSFNNIAYNSSISRYPNGTGNIQQSNATPLSFNTNELVQGNLFSQCSALFPNPADQIVYLSKSKDVLSWKIFNQKGILIMENKNIPSNSIFIEHLSEGYYILESLTINGINQQIFIKK